MKQFNKGTVQGKNILEMSIKKFGCLRSVVVDKNGEPIIGKKVFEIAKQMGIPTQEIETTGDRLIIVKRTDVVADSRKGKEMDFVDNLSSEQGLNWDNEYILETMNTEWGFDPRNYGVEMSLDKEFNIEHFFKEIKNKPIKNDYTKVTQRSLFDEL